VQLYPGHNFAPEPLPYPAPLPREQVELWDLHTYAAADWFVQNLQLFDTYNRSWPHVFVSEYAAQCALTMRDNQPACLTGTLFNAVMEAAWMVRSPHRLYCTPCGSVRSCDTINLEGPISCQHL
jgi:hypothetical protein